MNLGIHASNFQLGRYPYTGIFADQKENLGESREFFFQFKRKGGKKSKVKVKVRYLLIRRKIYKGVRDS